MEIRIQAEALNPWQAIIDYQSAHAELEGRYGGLSVFIGAMRDLNDGEAVRAMTLEHYPGMTEKFLQRVSEEAAEEWDIIDSLVVHRYGELAPGDPIVLVAVWSAHRAEAFAACRYIIDELKTRAPFWKNETTPEGRRWVSPE
jgi:molybdopterin synthase catalytic subunit